MRRFTKVSGIALAMAQTHFTGVPEVGHPGGSCYTFRVQGVDYAIPQDTFARVTQALWLNNWEIESRPIQFDWFGDQINCNGANYNFPQNFNKIVQ